MKNDTKPLLQRTWMVWLCALACTALWGSAFPCIKVGYSLFDIGSSDTASQILFAGIRFFGAGILALIIGSIGQRKILRPRQGSIHKILILSVFQTALQYVLFYIGMAHTTGVKASILQGTGVLFSLLLVCLLFRTEKLTLPKTMGCVIGFVGIILVNFTGTGLNMDFRLIGEGFMILAALSYAFSSIFLKLFSEDDDPVMLSGYQFLVGGAAMIAIGAAFGGRLGGFTPASASLLLYMAFISAAAYSLWGILLKHNTVSRITVFTFMTQIFGVVFSTLFLQERNSFGWQAVIALALVCIGIILVNKKSVKQS
ncbi:MAG: DMT family transporter [Clostridiales bacterium]|nr:DMT family transporter [Clostridiales bacterium]